MGICIIAKDEGDSMEDVSLIKKIKYHPNSLESYPVTFNLGSDFSREGIKKAYTLIKEEDLLCKDLFILKNDSFTIQILLDNIPKITSILLENKLPFFGVYVLYDNFLQMEKGEENE